MSNAMKAFLSTLAQGGGDLSGSVQTGYNMGFNRRRAQRSDMESDRSFGEGQRQFNAELPIKQQTANTNWQGAVTDRMRATNEANTSDPNYKKRMALLEIIKNSSQASDVPGDARMQIAQILQGGGFDEPNSPGWGQADATFDQGRKDLTSFEGSKAGARESAKAGVEARSRWAEAGFMDPKVLEDPNYPKGLRPQPPSTSQTMMDDRQVKQRLFAVETSTKRSAEAIRMAGAKGDISGNQVTEQLEAIANMYGQELNNYPMDNIERQRRMNLMRVGLGLQAAPVQVGQTQTPIQQPVDSLDDESVYLDALPRR